MASVSLPFSGQSLLAPATSGIADRHAHSSRAEAKAITTPSGKKPSPTTSEKGPWGRLETFPFFLEAPPHLQERFPLPNPKPRWFAPAAEASQVLDRLVRAGLPGEMLQAINHPSNRAIIGDQIVFFPPPLGLLRLQPEVRAAIYRELRRYPANVDIVGPVVIASNDVDEWFAETSLRPELIALIKQMSYPRGDALVFSDASVLMGSVQGEAEARALVTALCRTRAVMVKLIFDTNSKVADLTSYWTGPNRRHRNISALLRSMTNFAEGEKLDIVHLLPALCRKLLFSYPDLSMIANGQVPDCHWTSLNFFNPEPEPFYLDSRLATTAVLERYVPVKPPYQFGDILVFLDNAQGNAFHSCVHIAGDIAFTKNGRNLLSPWVFQSMDHLKKTYLFENNGRIQGYRARDASRSA